MPTTLVKEEQKHILRVLPILLRKDTQFKDSLYSILSETFAKNVEIKQILEEMRISREEANKRFEASDKRFEKMQEEMRISREETNKRFEEMQQETNKRFEEMQQETNKRFEAMQQETNKRFEEMYKEMCLRFEAVDKRFEEMHKEMHLGFESVDKQLEEQRKETRKLGMSIRTIGSRWGKETEVAIRKTLKELLLKKIDVKEVSEWKIKDKEGRVGFPNSQIQADLLIRNGEHFLAEIKSSADEAHVDRLYKIGELYAEKVGITPKLLFVAVTMDQEGVNLCQKLGIQLITYDELEEE